MADDGDPAPVVRDDRTGRGADAADDSPCGTSGVTFTATDATGNEATCTTLVRIVPGRTSFLAVLRGEAREAPTAIAPTGSNLATTTWADPEPGGALVFFSVRSVRCDGSLSPD